MIKNFKIGKINIDLVFRHKFEKDLSRFDTMFNKYELGFWYRKSMIVGSKNFTEPKNWTHVASHMIGINLLVCKAWITVDRGGMHMEIDA